MVEKELIESITQIGGLLTYESESSLILLFIISLGSEDLYHWSSSFGDADATYDDTCLSHDSSQSLSFLIISSIKSSIRHHDTDFFDLA